MTEVKITQKDKVAIVVRHIPGCVLRDVCEALDIPSSAAGSILRALASEGTIIRSHNGTQFTYEVAPGAEIPDIQLPFMLEKADPAIIRAAEEKAEALEKRGLWRRAATMYTSILELARNSNEVQRIAQRRDECLRSAKR